MSAPAADRPQGRKPPSRRAPATPDASTALDRYFGRDDTVRAHRAAQAVRDALRTFRAQALPEWGTTPGETARWASSHFERERRELEAARPGSLEDTTELRDALAKSNTYLRAWTVKASMLRALRDITGLRGHRCTNCLRTMQRGARAVQVWATTAPAGGTPRGDTAGRGDGGRRAAKYSGVAVCGNAWVCPVCAPRITEARRLELRAAVQRHRAGGGVAALCTFTFSHGPGEPLREQWGRLGRALERFARDVRVKRFRRIYGWCGRIRAREITFGLNGWHPHAHTLELFEATRDGLCPLDELTLADERRELAAAWRKACRQVGLDASLEHGFRIDVTTVDDYVAKWGTDAELTKWHQKSGRLELDAEAEGALYGCTPFDLLRIFAGELEAPERLRLGRDRAGALFAEYARAVHGTAQLHWTRGLKDALKGAEQPDAPKWELLGELTPREWRAVQQMGAQVELLGIAAVSWDAARAFVEHWVDRCERWSRQATRRTVRNRGLAYLFRGAP